MTRWLVTGAHGMLGHDLQAALAGRELTALGRADLDITDADAVERAVAGHDVVVNAAAYTRVDDAQTDVEAAYAVNAVGAGLVAAAAARAGARLVHVSTDYVFDGTSVTPYAEDAALSPVSVYGASKAEGERLVRHAHPDALVLRTAWLYGASGPNFVSAILRAARAGDAPIPVLTDQRGQPTWSRDVADRIVLAVDTALSPGVYHVTSAGEANRFEFAREILRLAGLDEARVIAGDGIVAARPAPRPAYSVLGHDAWGELGGLRPWGEALEAAADAGLLDPPRG